MTADSARNAVHVAGPDQAARARSSRRFGSAALVLTLAMEATCAVLVALSPASSASSAAITALIAIPTFALLAAVGMVILSRMPWHPVGLVFALCPLAMMTANVSSFYYDAAPAHDWPGRAAAALLGNASWIAGAGAAAVFLPLLFPTGRYLTPRWRGAGLAGAAGLVSICISAVLTPGEIDGFEEIVNPLGIDALRPVVEVTAILGFVLAGSAILLGLGSMLLRFRRARGVEREQMKWFLAACCWALLFFAVISPLLGLAGYYPPDFFYLASIALVPFSVAVAMLRYHLYDIDRIINRTLVYALLSAGLGGTYALLIVGLQAVLRPLSGGSDLAIVVTTLTVAALFLPARRRVQQTVDRRFNRRAYDAARTIEAFSARLRQQIELDTLQRELVGVVDETMAPSRASLWLRPTL